MHWNDRRSSAIVGLFKDISVYALHKKVKDILKFSRCFVQFRELALILVFKSRYWQYPWRFCVVYMSLMLRPLATLNYTVHVDNFKFSLVLRLKSAVGIPCIRQLFCSQETKSVNLRIFSTEILGCRKQSLQAHWTSCFNANVTWLKSLRARSVISSAGDYVCLQFSLKYVCLWQSFSYSDYRLEGQFHFFLPISQDSMAILSKPKSSCGYDWQCYYYSGLALSLIHSKN